MRIHNIVETNHQMGNWLKDNKGKRKFRNKEKHSFGKILEREIERTEDGGIFIGRSVTKADVLKVEDMIRRIEI